MITLFKENIFTDATQTQLAYRAKYWPHNKMSPATKDLIRYNKFIYLKRSQIEALCNEDMNQLYYNGQWWHICWAYNNMPTEKEWNSRTDASLIRIELRKSPAIPERAVALLSFELPSERLNAHAQGDS